MEFQPSPNGRFRINAQRTGRLPGACNFSHERVLLFSRAPTKSAKGCRRKLFWNEPWSEFRAIRGATPSVSSIPVRWLEPRMKHVLKPWNDAIYCHVGWRLGSAGVTWLYNVVRCPTIFCSKKRTGLKLFEETDYCSIHNPKSANICKRRDVLGPCSRVIFLIGIFWGHIGNASIMQDTQFLQWFSLKPLFCFAKQTLRIKPS